MTVLSSGARWSAAFASAGAEAARVYDDIMVPRLFQPWADGKGLTAEIEAAGFTATRTSRHRLPVIFDGGPGQLLQTLATTGVAAAVAALGDPGRRALAAATEAAAAPLMQDGAIRSEAAARLVTATAA
jgi:hypothetical protein